MSKSKYNLLFKTGDAELRALKNLLCRKDNIFPIIELTRGRKSKKEKIGKIERRLETLADIFSGEDICLDLTTSSDLANEEIETLFNPQNGYSAWITFLNDLNNDQVYKSITPTILVDIDDSDLATNLRLQVDNLSKYFSTVAYRNSIADDGCYDDIKTIKDIVRSNSIGFYFIVDCEYIAPGAWRSFADKIAVRITKINKLIENVQYIITSTSFPRYVSEIGQDDSDTFKLNEIDLYNEVFNRVHNITKNIHYGDYGTINPVRNDAVVMSRGWIPRIDVPLSETIFYYRLRRATNKYSETYKEIAKNCILKDKRFPKHLTNNWGIKQIKGCANGDSPGSSPSFWISVRMNIHIEQQLHRLQLL